MLVHHLVKTAWPNEFMGLVPALFAVPSIAALVVLIKAMPAMAQISLSVFPVPIY